jgi:hypothetical protein
MTVAASIVINYGDSAAASALVSVELDKVLNVDADGKEKTQFYPGDQVWFWVHHDDTVRIASVLTTSGDVSGGGVVGRTLTGQMLFKSPTDEIDLSHIATSVSAVWYGRESGLTLSDSRKLTAANTPCIGEITYGLMVHLYCLTPPDLTLDKDEKYYIGVVINMESVA